MLQPTTKALAQMLAGNTKMSGQLVNARNVLSQAQRLVEERAVERMPPAHREEFLEQVARLKLTIADAEEAGFHLENEPAAEARPPAPPVGVDLLRDVARRLAMSETPAAPAQAAPAPEQEEDAAAPPVERSEQPSAEPAAPHARGERLRLRISNSPDGAAPVRAPDRLRLRSLKPAATSGD